jgi:hypothetical protein
MVCSLYLFISVLFITTPFIRLFCLCRFLLSSLEGMGGNSMKAEEKNRRRESRDTCRVLHIINLNCKQILFLFSMHIYLFISLSLLHLLLPSPAMLHLLLKCVPLILFYLNYEIYTSTASVFLTSLFHFQFSLWQFASRFLA